jgi:hypothetical protein
MRASNRIQRKAWDARGIEEWPPFKDRDNLIIVNRL